LKGVKDNNSVVYGRQIDHPKGTRSLPYADLPHTWTNRFHGLPVSRVKALLDLTQLITGLRSSLLWKVPQPSKTIAKEKDGLHDEFSISFDTVWQAIFR